MLAANGITYPQKHTCHVQETIGHGTHSIRHVACVAAAKGQQILSVEVCLEGVAPRVVTCNVELTVGNFNRYICGASNQHSANLRAMYIQETSSFRAMDSPSVAFNLGFKPRYEVAVRHVGEVKGPWATDESGGRLLTVCVQFFQTVNRRRWPTVQ